jgi:small subunit ribosomal protein S16
MAVKIRLKRMGAKKKPFYRVVVADSRSPRDGRFIEELGWFDPLKDPAEIKIDVESARKWIGNGAQPTDTARALLKKAGVYDEPEEADETGEESAEVQAEIAATGADAGETPDSYVTETVAADESPAEEETPVAYESDAAEEAPAVNEEAVADTYAQESEDAPEESPSEDSDDADVTEPGYTADDADKE